MALRPLFWLALSTISLALAVIGAFGTQTVFDLPQRLAYWSVVAASSFFVAYGTMIYLLRRFDPRPRSGMGSHAMAGAIAGLPVFLVVSAINLIVFGGLPGIGPKAVLLVYCIVITSTVGTILSMLSPNR